MTTLGVAKDVLQEEKLGHSLFTGFGRFVDQQVNDDIAQGGFQESAHGKSPIGGDQQETKESSRERVKWLVVK